MARIDHYQEYIDVIYDALTAEPTLDPTQTDAVRYIRQMRKNRRLPGEGLPGINIYHAAQQEEHIQIGYNPLVTYITRITIRCMLPGDYPSAVLSALDLSAVNEPEEADMALFLIADKVEEVMRRDANIRPTITGNDVMIMRPNGVTFSAYSVAENKEIYQADVSILSQARINNP